MILSIELHENIFCIINIFSKPSMVAINSHDCMEWIDNVYVVLGN